MTEKFLALMENYFEDCKQNGFSDFEVWCEDNLETDEEEDMLDEIGHHVTFIADKLFPKPPKITEVVKFKLNGEDIFGVYKSKLESYNKEDFLKWLAKRNECKPEDITMEVISYDANDRHFEEFFCDMCYRMEVYKLTDKERRDLDEYIGENNPDNVPIKKILPRMQPWCRDSYVWGMSYTNCVCPTCAKELGLEDDDEFFS